MTYWPLACQLPGYLVLYKQMVDAEIGTTQPVINSIMVCNDIAGKL